MLCITYLGESWEHFVEKSGLNPQPTDHQAGILTITSKSQL